MNCSVSNGDPEGKFVDQGMPSSRKKVFPWTTENSAMSGSRASLEHEQRLCVEEIDRTGRLYWMIRIPASQHLRRMGATATPVRSSTFCTNFYFIYYSWNGGRAEAVCAGGKGVRMR